jgi:ABC-2 type transport system permease protein
MNGALIRITASHLLGQRRFFGIAALMLIPIAVAILFRVATDGRTPPEQFAPNMIRALIVTLLLPLVTLVLGTSALGSEIEDGTAVYLLATPVERWRIILVKVAVATIAGLVMLVPATLITGLLVMSGDVDRLAVGFAVAVGLGVLVYTSLFIALSIRTSRALLIGLGYVFVWEGVVTSLFAGTRWVSVREWVLGLVELVSTASASVYGANLDGTTALVAVVVATAGAFVLSVRWLTRFEIGERT